MKKSLIFAIPFLILNSCSSSRIVLLNSTQKYAPIMTEQVIIYTNEQDIPTNYQKLAIITTNYVAGQDKSKWRNVRNKCAKIGANGVISEMELRASAGARVAAAIFGGFAQDKAEFLAIRVTDKNSNQNEKTKIENRIVQNSTLIPTTLQQKIDKQKKMGIGANVLFDVYGVVYEGKVIKFSNNGYYAIIEYKDLNGKTKQTSRVFTKLQPSETK